jgi:hypothetical protein
MAQICKVGVVMGALMLPIFPLCNAGAQAPAVKVTAAPVHVKALVIKDPPPVQLGAALQNQQNLSNAGVQTNIRHKRDRLQRKSKPGGSKTD